MSHTALHLPISPAHEYIPRKAEDSDLYKIIQNNLESYLYNLEQIEEKGLPSYIKQEFYSFLKCGIYAHGFLRLNCTNCKKDLLLAFSCKKRGFCPSCGVRRMAESAALLTEHVFPKVATRQWVLSFPFQIRFLLSSKPKLMGKCLEVAHRAIQTFYRQKTESKSGATGAVSFIQRFGSSVNLNIHFHMIFLDGVFDSPNKFIPSPKFQDYEMETIIQKISHRIIRYLVKQQHLIADSDYINDSDESAITKAQAASIQYRIAFGEKSGQKVQQLGAIPYSYFSEEAKLQGKLCTSINGFSLHAKTAFKSHQRKKLEKLCRYVARPAISNQRISISNKGNIIYELKTPYKNGTTHLEFTPNEFLEKLTALIPKPRINLIRYSGALAPNAKIRKHIIPNPKLEFTKDQNETNIQRPYRIAWAKLLKRVFKIDLERCPKCNGELKFIAAIQSKQAIEKILSHLKIASNPPKSNSFSLLNQATPHSIHKFPLFLDSNPISRLA